MTPKKIRTKDTVDADQECEYNNDYVFDGYDYAFDNGQDWSWD